ncbi:MAG: AMIN domain-containing protein [Pseudomonadota bacterium]|nr:AMIN domain-containing protein [Pseudomonadota bacterium]
MHLGREYLYGGIKRGTAARALALAGLILLAGAFGAIRDAVAATTVTDIRAGRHPDKIRLVLDLNGPVTFETFTLPDPYRVVVDLNEVKWAQSRPPRLGITEISNFRFGLFKPGTSRLVVDTTVPLAIAKTLLLAPTAKVKHHRLIIDLRRIS